LGHHRGHPRGQATPDEEGHGVKPPQPYPPACSSRQHSPLRPHPRMQHMAAADKITPESLELRWATLTRRIGRARAHGGLMLCLGIAAARFSPTRPISPNFPPVPCTATTSTAFVGLATVCLARWGWGHVGPWFCPREAQVERMQQRPCPRTRLQSTENEVVCWRPGGTARLDLDDVRAAAWLWPEPSAVVP
jgi:hypothetical protein